MLETELRNARPAAAARPTETSFTAGRNCEFAVTRRTVDVDGDAAIAALVDGLDRSRGAVFTSGFEYPGRYSRWDTGFVDPPLAIEVRGDR
ncbi:MAG: hypothetical protein OXH64_01230, partial [Rhodospirillaceae bacterium]|nr:hypothetical protein [Rhodospirillaceae bacterium]